MQQEHEKYMKRALQLAKMGKFTVSPNPRVGAVIVHQNKIIGEGFHRKYGNAHAEVEAINSVSDKTLLKDSTIYVTLEPCAHFGKTPPCADLIIENEIPNIVIACRDPFKAVDGKGIEKLKQAGRNVIIGVLAKESHELNRRFFTFYQQKRPYIILKWAETADGFIGRSQDDDLKEDNWITSPLSKQLVHLWRAEESAILVGKNTAKIDNPALTCREVKGKNPIRVVIDKNLELPSTLNIFNSEARTIIINATKDESSQHLEWIKINFEQDIPSQICNILHELKIESLIVEGGRQTLQSFIDSNLWDESRRFIGKKKFKRGIKAPTLESTYLRSEKVGTDLLYFYRK